MSLENASFFWTIVAAIITSSVTTIGALWAFGEKIIAPAFKEKSKQYIYEDKDLNRWLNEKFLAFIYTNPDFERWLREFCKKQFDLENDGLEEEVSRINEFLQYAVYDQKDGVLPKLLRSRGRNKKNFDKLNNDVKEIKSLIQSQNHNNYKMLSEISYNRRLADAIKNYLTYNSKNFPQPFKAGSDDKNLNDYAQNLITELKIDQELNKIIDDTENSAIDYYFNPVQKRMKNAFESQVPQEDDEDE